jgi:hypothetical protein
VKIFTAPAFVERALQFISSVLGQGPNSPSSAAPGVIIIPDPTLEPDFPEISSRLRQWRAHQEDSPGDVPGSAVQFLGGLGNIPAAPATGLWLCAQGALPSAARATQATNAPTPTRKRKRSITDASAGNAGTSPRSSALSWRLKRQGFNLTVLSGRFGSNSLGITECCRESKICVQQPVGVFFNWLSA